LRELFKFCFKANDAYFKLLLLFWLKIYNPNDGVTSPIFKLDIFSTDAYALNIVPYLDGKLKALIK
jgi:hypothetical protein